MATFPIKAHYYQQFDADYSLPFPGEGYGGWKQTEVELSRERTALVVMHAWDVPPREVDAAGYGECEYLPRADRICREVMPGLLSAARAGGFRVFHVVGHRGYYEELPGHRRAVALAGPAPAALPRVPTDAALERLQAFRSGHVWPGEANLAIRAASKLATDFHPSARPVGDEGVAADAHQLGALCVHHGVNHLVYTGFTVGGCLLTSPGGMLDMQRRGAMCSVIREAVTAIENRETARTEGSKALELWRVALLFGFVFDLKDFVESIGGERRGA